MAYNISVSGLTYINNTRDVLKCVRTDGRRENRKLMRTVRATKTDWAVIPRNKEAKQNEPDIWKHFSY